MKYKIHVDKSTIYFNKPNYLFIPTTMLNKKEEN